MLLPEIGRKFSQAFLAKARLILIGRIALGTIEDHNIPAKKIPPEAGFLNYLFLFNLSGQSRFRHFKGILDLICRDHLNRVMLGQRITDSDANFTTFAPVYRHIGGFAFAVIQDRICFGTILGTQTTTGL